MAQKLTICALTICYSYQLQYQVHKLKVYYNSLHLVLEYIVRVLGILNSCQCALLHIMI